jgi:hypothetical protein
MSQPVGTESNAPKNQLPVFNPANFIIDQTASQASAIANVDYITNSNTAQSAQITANTTLYNTLFPTNPTIYLGDLALISSATGVWNVFFTQPALPANVFYLANLVGSASWGIATTGYVWIQIVDSVTAIVIHNSYIYPNYNKLSIQQVINIARQIAFKGTGNALNFQIQVVTATSTTATIFPSASAGVYGSSPQLFILNLNGQN